MRAAGSSSIALSIALSIGAMASCGWFTEDDKQQAEAALKRAGQASSEISSEIVDRTTQRLESIDLERVEARVRDATRTLRSDPANATPSSRNGRASSIDWLDLPADAVRCDSPRQCRVEAAFATAARADPLSAVPGAKLQVVSQGGRPSGVRIEALPEGSAPHELGFRSGDVIRTINGIAVALPQTQFQLMMQLRGARRFEVEFERAGKTRRVSIEIVTDNGTASGTEYGTNNRAEGGVSEG